MDTPARTPSVDDLLAHAGWVRALARRLVRDASTADDLAQETWVAALGGARGTDESPRGWLGRVLRNRMLQRVRSERARSERERASNPLARSSGDMSVPSSDELLVHIEHQRLLAGALAALREPLRTTVLLRYYEGLDAAEIARRLGEEPATIRQRLKRGLDALREDLDGRHDGGREAWLSALLPLAELGRSKLTGTSAASVLGGALVVKKIAAVAGVLALAGGAVLYFDRARVLEPEPTIVGAEPGAVALVAPPLDADPAPSADRTATPPTSEPPARPVREALPTSADTSQHVRGRVTWPIARPTPDETLEVFALSAPMAYTPFVRLVDEGSAGEIVARTSVLADGSFDLALPPDAKAAHLMVRGRYLYLEETVAIDLGGTPSVVLSPVCGAWVRGRVVAPAGTAADGLEGVRLRLWVDEIFGEGTLGRTRFTDVADADGRFEMRAVIGRPGGTLLALPGPFAARLLALDGVEACTELELEVPLAVGGSLAGRVVDTSGAPIASADVRAILRGRYFGFDDQEVGTAVTGSDGRFSIDRLPPGELFVTASHGGYLESEKLEANIVDREVARGFEVELSSGRRVAGRATYADGTAAADVAVTVEFDASFQVGVAAFNSLRGASGHARTDANGDFRVGGLGSGPFVVEASHADDDVVLTGRADGVPPDTDDVRLVLLPELELRGKVTIPSGAPVTAFRVRAVRVTEGAVGETATHEESRAFASADGTFTLTGLLAGRWRVAVDAEELARSDELSVELPGADALAFVLTPPATVSGVVVGPDGAPVADASVALDTGQSQWEARFAGSDDPPSTTTDGRGRFQLAGLRAGEVRIRAGAAGFAMSPPFALDLIEGENRGRVTLQLTRGGRLTGEVFEGGVPAAGRVISLVQWERGAFDTAMAETDAEGLFEFANVEPGSWTIVALDLKADWSASDDGTSMAQRMASMKSARVKVAEGSDEHVVLGAPPKSAVVLRGHVMRGGAPYTDAMLAAVPIGAGSGAETNMTGVDRRGSYELTVDGAGPYQLVVNRMGRAAGEINVLTFLREIPDEPEVVIDLEIPGGGLAGRVVDASQRGRVGVGVTLFPGRDASPEQMFSARYAQTTTDADGRFEIADLAPGNYRLGASADANGDLAGVVLPAIDVADGEWKRDLVLELPRAASALVRVLDSFGRPVAGVAVFAWSADGSVVHPISPVRSDDAGLARYTGLAPGTYTFSGRNFEFVGAQRVGADLRTGATTEVDLPVVLGGYLVLSAKDSGAELGPTAFRVVDEHGYEVANLFTDQLEAQEQSTAALAGKVRVGPLPPGTYRATAFTREGATDTRSVAIKSGVERKLALRPGS